MFGTCQRILSLKTIESSNEDGVVGEVGEEVQQRTVWKKIKYKSSTHLLIKFQPKDVLYLPLAGIKYMYRSEFANKKYE